MGAFVLSKSIVCSVKKTCLQGLSVLFKRFVCSLKKVCMFFQKSLSVLSKKCNFYVNEVKKSTATPASPLYRHRNRLEKNHLRRHERQNITWVHQCIHIIKQRCTQKKDRKRFPIDSYGPITCTWRREREKKIDKRKKQNIEVREKIKYEVSCSCSCSY